MDTWHKISKSLFPTGGEAFKFPFSSNHDKLLRAFASEPARITEFFNVLKDNGIPTLKMTADVLEDWERQLGISLRENLDEIQRKKIIMSLYYLVGGQGKDYIQDEIQKMGFPLFVFENVEGGGVVHQLALLGKFQLGYVQLNSSSSKSHPGFIRGTLYPGPPWFHGEKNYSSCELGNVVMGGFQLGDYTSYTNTTLYPKIPTDMEGYIFFIFLCGENGPYEDGDFVNIPKARRLDFEEFLYKIKPAHVWIIAQVNWV